MKRIVLIILLSHSFSGKAQGYCSQFGLGAGYAQFNLAFEKYKEVQTENSSFIMPFLFYKLYIDVGYTRVGSSGVSVMLDLGAGKNNNAFSVLTTANVLGQFYLGDCSDPSFYMGVGGGFSIIGSLEGGGGIIGPEFELGKQFLLGGQSFSVSGSVIYGLNKDHVSTLGATKVFYDDKYLINLRVGYLLNNR